jgi:PAS domain S-box-containing protein
MNTDEKARAAGPARSDAPSNLELARINESLRVEIAQRRKAETEFRVLFESAPDAIVLADATGRIVLINAQTENWFGYARQELIGQPIEILVPAAIRDAHRAHRDGYFAGPRQRPMGIGLELHATRKDGSNFPVEISLTPIRHEDGMLVSATIRDISERKLAEKARSEIQERFRELANNLPVGVFRFQVEPEERFLESNSTMATMFGADAGVLASCHVRDLFADPMQWTRLISDVQHRGAVHAQEFEMVSLAGKPFWAAVTTVIKDSGGGRFLDGLVEDISDYKLARQQIHDLNEHLRRRARELESVNKELEAFSYSVSHDLRAPLRSIDGFSQALLEDCAERLDAGGRDYLERVRAASQRMAGLIDDMLTLSRVTRTELRKADIDLSALAAEVAEALRRDHPDHAVDLTIQPGLAASGDPKLIRILLENLLANAWKFTGRTPKARVEFGARDDGSDSPVYFVKDNGAGFDMAYAQKLFAAFQRLHSPAEFAGSGIGLATVQRVLHRHGGRAWAEGKPGAGATFYFTLGPN